MDDNVDFDVDFANIGDIDFENIPNGNDIDAELGNLFDDIEGEHPPAFDFQVG